MAGRHLLAEQINAPAFLAASMAGTVGALVSVLERMMPRGDKHGPEAAGPGRHRPACRAGTDEEPLRFSEPFATDILERAVAPLFGAEKHEAPAVVDPAVRPDPSATPGPAGEQHAVPKADV